MEHAVLLYSLANIGLAFIEGFALILSPCILPILPIVLSGSIEGGKNRSFGIIGGFVLTFSLFTVFSRTLVHYFAINLDFVRQVAFGLIVLFGLILISDKLSNAFSLYTQRIANVGQRDSSGEASFTSGLILGALISFIWVPCAGPILAAAIIQVAVQNTLFESFLVFFFFALGSVIPMILIAFAGRKIIQSVPALKTHTHLLRKVFGGIIIIAALIAAFVSPTASVNKITSKANQAQNSPSTQIVAGLETAYPAPPILGIDAWINSQPLTIADLKGRVILIDFWTYSCINCIRTLPYLKNWYNKYHDQGFVIIGVHTPEFEFEKNFDNVKNAVEKFQIPYPIALDSHYGTWLSFHNHYWPAHYLIDKNGMIVYVHFGEGGYDIAEHNIVALLGVKNDNIKNIESNAPISTLLAQTPETYLGYSRQNSYAGNQTLVQDQISNYQYPQSLPLHHWALNGIWDLQDQQIVSMESNAALKIHFFAGKVYAVMGSNDNKPIKLRVQLNNQTIGSNAGKDVTNGTITLTEHRLYEVVDSKQPINGTLELIPESSGATFYTFTFGN